MSTNSTDSDRASFLASGKAIRAVHRIAGATTVAKAVLLYGADGVGKRHLADRLAKSWLCMTPIEGAACGDCPACISFDNGLNADLLLLEPTGPSDVIRLDAVSDGKGENRKEVFPIQRFLRTIPLRSRCKIVLIEEANRMNLPSQHALLKSLEEPESYARFILTASRHGDLLPTVCSRCAAVPCGAPDALGHDGLRLTPGKRARLESKGSLLSSICQIARECLHDPVSAIRLADEFKDLAAEAKSDDESSVRGPQLEAIEILAEAFRAARAFEAASLAARAHRRVQSNGHFGVVVDALFTRIATQC